jgi:orotate phosphoribosyltransferase
MSMVAARRARLEPHALEALREAVKGLVLTRGYERRSGPFRLSSGEWSHDYIDGKRALSSGTELVLAAKCIWALAAARDATFEAVGGLTMGADPLACGVAMVGSVSWFSVRKQPKPHGKQRLIEGAEIRSGMSVLLVDDVVTTGGSILKALDAIEAAGGSVALAVTLVDRGDSASVLLRDRGVAYEPVLTYRDLDIRPINPSDRPS